MDTVAAWNGCISNDVFEICILSLLPWHVLMYLRSVSTIWNKRCPYLVKHVTITTRMRPGCRLPTFPNLTYLDLGAGSNITNISSFTKCRELRMGDNNRVADISKLTELRIFRTGGNVIIRSISTLVNLADATINTGNHEKGVSSLTDLTRLVVLHGFGEPDALARDKLPESLIDLSFMTSTSYNLAHLTNLTRLTVTYWPDTSAIEDMTQLQSLTIRRGTNILNLQQLTNLGTLRLNSHSGAYGFTALPSLTHLDLTNSSTGEDLSHLVNLTSLDIGDTSMPDLRPLVNLTALHRNGRTLGFKGLVARI